MFQALAMEMRSRVEQSKGSGEFKELHRTFHWDPKKTAICGMITHTEALLIELQKRRSVNDFK